MSEQWSSPAGDKECLLCGGPVVPALHCMQVCLNFPCMAKLLGCESPAVGYQDLRPVGYR